MGISFFPGIHGSNSQTAEVIPEHDLTTEQRVLIEKAIPPKEYIKILNEDPVSAPQTRRENSRLDDVTVDDVKVVSNSEIKPESASRVVMPIKNNTNVIVHEKIDQNVLIHAVQHLDDAIHHLDNNVLRILPNKTENKKQKHAHYDDFTGELTHGTHPCQRECKEGGERMICYYHFSMEWYQTMSKACYNCPYNKSDCSRKDCIPADGMNRALNVINRKMPGPSVEVRIYPLYR